MLNIGTEFHVDMKQSISERVIFNSFALGCLVMGAGVNEQDSPKKIVERLKVFTTLWETKGFLMSNKEWIAYVDKTNEWGYRGCELQETIENVILCERSWQKAIDDGWSCNVSRKSDREFVLTIARKVFSNALMNSEREFKYFESFEEEDDY